MLAYPTFSQLNSAELADILALMQEVVSEYNPDIDLRRGVVNDLAVYPRALLAATTDQAVATALDATSLSNIVANPAIADADSVNRVLGNFRLTRQPATASTGSLAIVLSQLIRTTIAVGTTFTMNGQVFVATQTYNGQISEEDVLLPTDSLISAVSGGYRFVIPLTAVVAGSAGNVRRGASATPSSSLYAF